ncbi:hypothetical protein SCE1572_20400 [Sorangium cellulosum So0157-2]|uniref:Uncharacterized protein n=1 Tax=Sorangium cellulosum So0157-2 TaxID=1254432 RepID=S4Y152_SORCE|nr:hypothetical protein SCE1572_20400 [Sorangium cellulosum So0157-2]
MRAFSGTFSRKPARHARFAIFAARASSRSRPSAMDRRRLAGLDVPREVDGAERARPGPPLHHVMRSDPLTRRHSDNSIA